MNQSDEGLDDLLGGTEIYEDDGDDDYATPLPEYDEDDDGGDLFDL
jgi:hypothetical protein